MLSMTDRARSIKEKKQTDSQHEKNCEHDKKKKSKKMHFIKEEKNLRFILCGEKKKIKEEDTIQFLTCVHIKLLQFA